MDVTGNPLATDWSGDIYIQASSVVGNEILRDAPVQTRGGAANLRLWTRWQKTKLIEASGDINYNDFKLVAGRDPFVVFFINKLYRHDGEVNKVCLVNSLDAFCNHRPHP